MKQKIDREFVNTELLHDSNEYLENFSKFIMNWFYSIPKEIPLQLSENGIEFRKKIFIFIEQKPEE